ncbi:MAG TPA: DUF6456 domain-containing protein [Rhizomicrobium sp.]|nr:DUF6456 domain-containing protein [Rhizomicrobium sp.]
MGWNSLKPLPQHEVEAAARRVLEALEEGGHLVPTNRKCYGLVAGAAPDEMRVSSRLVRELRARDWLGARGTEPETFVISDPGLFWLRRQRAPHDPFGAQHRLDSERRIRLPDGREESVTVDEGESPLGWLLKRGSIDVVQCEAGERLRRDYTLSQMSPRMCAALDVPLVDGLRGSRPQAELADVVVAARQRFSRAMRAAGPVISGLLFDVCCHLMGLEEAEIARAWPRRAAKVVLVIGLDRLAAHYGLSTARSHAPVRAWRQDDAA